MKIQDLPLEDRPREKAIKYGVETLSNEELIALIIGGGTKEKNATELAASLISETGGIKGLLTSSYQQIKG